MTDDVWAMLRAADDAAAGHLPVSGGMLDQTQAFRDAYARIRAESSRWERDR